MKFASTYCKIVKCISQLGIVISIHSNRAISLLEMGWSQQTKVHFYRVKKWWVEDVKKRNMYGCICEDYNLERCFLAPF